MNALALTYALGANAFFSAKDAYIAKWEAKHGEGSFDNRWCWVYDVKRVQE